MNGWMRAFARVLLALHPRAFRRAWGDAYLEAAEHRVRLERARRARGALRRALGVLVLDALRSVPREWIEVFGGAHGIDRAPDVWRGGTMTGWVEGWWWDFRIAARGLARRPGMSALVMATLALGVGANAAIFGALDRVVLNPLTFEGGERAVYLMSQDVEQGFTFSATQAMYERWREGARSFERVEAFRPKGGLTVRGDVAETVHWVGVSAGLADMIGAVPIAGRSFVPEDSEPGAPPVLMIAEDKWRTDFGADPRAIGSTIQIDDEPVTVVGVWPRSGLFSIEDDPAYYRPLERGGEIDRSDFSIVIALLAEDVSTEQAEAELAALAASVDDPDLTAGFSERSEKPVVLPPHAFVPSDFKGALWVLFVGVGLLLVVAGVNASNILLNRAVDREGELGVRLALGGASSRLLRQFLLEGGLLALGGAAIGVAAARWGTVGLAAFLPPDVPEVVLSTAGPRTIAYASLLVVALTMICGLVPALHMRSPEVRALMGSGSRSGTRGRRRLRSLLVVGQVALSVVMVLGGWMSRRSMERYRAIDFGVELDELVVVTARRPAGLYESRDERRALAQRLVESFGGLPGVASASVSAVLPLNYSVRFGEPYLEGDTPPSEELRTFSQSAGSSPGFLETVGLPLLEGRDFTPEEMADTTPGVSSVVLVNEGFAARYPGSVVGRALLFPGDTVGRRIVGVVGNVRTGNIRDATVRVQVYYPDDGIMSRSQRYLLRVEGDGELVGDLVRDRVAGLEPRLLVSSVQTGTEMVAERTAGSRFLAVILAVFGAMSLLLAVAGVYGAVNLDVSRRTREMGIRLALGAVPRRVAASVAAAGLAPVVAGMVVGLALATLLAGRLTDVLYDVSRWDPISLAGTVGVLGLSALLAAHLPARKATRVDPTVALRSE